MKWHLQFARKWDFATEKALRSSYESEGYSIDKGRTYALHVARITTHH
jgi:hypothetical protein